MCPVFWRALLAGALVMSLWGLSCASSDFQADAPEPPDGGAGADAGDVGRGRDAGRRDTSGDARGAHDVRPSADTREPGDSRGAHDATRPSEDGVSPEDARHDDPRADTRQPGACGGVVCAPDRVCDPARRTCVECIDDAQCEGSQVCNPATNTCVECLADSDCPGTARCHDRAPVCVPSCCDATPSEASLNLPNNPYGGFDVALDSNGTPQVAFYDKETDRLLFTTMISGHWLRTETIATLGTSGVLSLNLRMAVGPNDEPHLLVSKPYVLTHYWRESQNPSVWKSEELATNNASYYHVGIAFDAAGGLHMAATQFKAPMIYIYKTPTGLMRTPEVHDFSEVYEENTESLQLAVTRDARAIVATKYRKNIGRPDEEHRLRVYEKLANGSWSRELVGQDIADDFGLGLTPDGAPMLAYRRQPTDGVRLLRRSGGNWSDERIIANADYGYSLAMAADDLGDPHLVYRALVGGKFALFYTRWNGAAFEHHQLDNLTPEAVEYSNNPRIAVDARRGAHVLTYNSRNQVLVYRHLN